ncbi:leucine-rich repeat and death domain-containing protein 1-like [Lutzomyia longipalpis]|uniref:leucine-rich repeat and death domain-containing protein 1-like n=1 Tax=Lutzomyia longipalpis TaxID=7200 RepID=UPI002483EC7F|nr:leucine-rich repeat and death domain-containing protein 1-like [Lutzomyia longipalpis]
MIIWRCCLFLFLVLIKKTLGQDILCDIYVKDYYAGFSITNAKGYTEGSRKCSLDLSKTSDRRQNHTADAEKISSLIIDHAPSGYISQNLLDQLPNLQLLTVLHSNVDNTGKLSHKNIKTIFIESCAIYPINKYTFQNFPVLTEIAIYDIMSKENEDKIFILEDEAFSSLKNLRKIEIIIAPHLKIKENAFKNLNLTNLNLSFDSLNALDSSLLKTISNLEILKLNSNNFNELDTSVDSFSNDVESLNLTSIELNTLIASNNKLKNLIIGKNWNDLDVSNNKISEMSLKDSYSTLEHINLNNNLLKNNLREICQCVNLEKLFLNKNNISDIGSCFFNMKKLKTITLKGNDISVIYPDSFHPENNIEYLDLSDNKLEYFLKDSMKNFPKIQHINLNDNKIVALYDDPKHFMPALNEIEILGNNFECSELKKVWMKLNEQKVKIFDLDLIQCIDLMTDPKFSLLLSKTIFINNNLKKMQNSLSTVKEKQNTLEICIKIVNESVNNNTLIFKNFQAQHENKTIFIENELKSLKENSQKDYENKTNSIEEELKALKDNAIKLEESVSDKNMKINSLESYINSVNNTIAVYVHMLAEVIENLQNNVTFLEKSISANQNPSIFSILGDIARVIKGFFKNQTDVEYKSHV